MVFDSWEVYSQLVAGQNKYESDIARLHAKAEETRLRAVEAQLSFAFTLCAIAETEIEYSRPDEALRIVNKLWHHAKTIHTHLDELDHLPKTAIPNLFQANEGW